MSKYLSHIFFLILLTYISIKCVQSKEKLETSSQVTVASQDTLTICSFNIQFFGHFKKLDDQALVSILKDYDIIVVQEVVAPPVNGNYPNGDPYKPDVESKEFFDALSTHGFQYQAGRGEVVFDKS